MEEQQGIVIATNGQMAKVKASRHNDCENCGACPGNSAMVLDMLNPLGAKPGQRVAFEIQQTNMLKAAFVVYVLPLIAMFVGALAGSYLAGHLHYSALPCEVAGGIIAFILAVLYIKYFDSSAKSKDEMRPTIVRILS